MLRSSSSFRNSSSTRHGRAVWQLWGQGEAIEIANVIHYDISGNTFQLIYLGVRMKFRYIMWVSVWYCILFFHMRCTMYVVYSASAVTLVSITVYYFDYQHLVWNKHIVRSYQRPWSPTRTFLRRTSRHVNNTSQRSHWYCHHQLLVLAGI